MMDGIEDSVTDTSNNKELVDSSVVRKRPARDAQMSDKGKTYEKELTGTRFKHLTRRVQKQLQLIVGMYKVADREMVKAELHNLDKAFSELSETATRLLKVTDDETERVMYQDVLEKLEGDIVSTKKDVYDHISIHSQEGSQEKVASWLEKSPRKSEHSVKKASSELNILVDSDMLLCIGMQDMTLTSPSTLLAHAASLNGKLTQQVKVVELLLDSVDAKALKKELEIASNMVQQLSEINSNVSKLLPNEDDRVDEQTKLEFAESTVFQLKERVYAKLMTIDNDMRSKRSSRSGRPSKTSHSSHSNSSSKSFRSIDLKVKAEVLARSVSLNSKLSQQVKVVELLLESEDAEALRKELDIASSMAQQLYEISSKATTLLSNEDDKVDEQIKLEFTESTIFQLKERVYAKLMTIDEAKRSKRSSRSGRSSRTSQSSHSNSSSTSSRSLQHKVKAEGLKAEADSLRRIKTLKIQAVAKRKEEEIDLEIARLEMEIVKSEAIGRLYDEADGCMHHGRKQPEVTSTKELSNKEHRGESKSWKLDPCVDESDVLRVGGRFRKSTHSGSIKHPAIQIPKLQTTEYPEKYAKTSIGESHLSNAIMRLANFQAAPNAELDAFGGNPLQYDYFRATFRDVVEYTVPDQRGRMNRLLKYTTGEAKELIQPCVHEGDECCYTKAIALLDKEYGNSHRISCSYLKELREFPQIKPSDRTLFRKLYRFLLKCQAFKKNNMLKELDSTDYIRLVIAKLDISYEDRWTTLAENTRRKLGKEADFNNLVDFIDFHSSRVNDPAYSRDIMKEAKNLKVNASVLEEKTRELACCLFCKGNTCNHRTEECPVYLGKDVTERHRMVFENRLCFSCLCPISNNHRGKTCLQKKTCTICKKLHPTSLHKEAGERKSKDETFKTAASKYRSSERTSMCIVPVYISHVDNPSREVLVYAMLDNDSQGCFVSHELLETLSPVNTRETRVTMETINGVTEKDTIAVDGLTVRCSNEHAKLYSSSNIHLPTTYSVESLPFSRNEMPTPKKLNQWNYLTEVVKAIPPFSEDTPFGLMIGANCTRALEPQQVIPSEDEGPFAYRTALGWCTVGPISMNEVEANETLKCHCTSVAETIRFDVRDAVTGKLAQHHFTSNVSVQDKMVSVKLKEMYDLEFNEKDSESKALSSEDDMFLHIVKQGIRKEEGHYEVPLPFRSTCPVMPNNRVLALQRLSSTRRKMAKNEKFRKDYVHFMESLVTNGYARRCRTQKVKEGTVWYLPHHGVYHPAKPDKIRVVFDCSAEYQNRCLNDELLQGPDLANHLVGVLLRFRKEKVAFTGDIESMFYQIRVPESQRSYLRFLWWPKGDTSISPEEFEMCVHTFGAICSPSCANFTLKQAAEDNKEMYCKEACMTVDRDFYVDDLLKSCRGEPEAILILSQVQTICRAGGFNLIKILSTSHAVINSVLLEQRSPALKQHQLGEHLPTERALGVIWHVQADKLGFRISLQDSPLTRRGILSTISSVFDPLGLASPFLLKGRKVLQIITADGKGWDDEVESAERAAWSAWRLNLPLLQQLTVHRSYKPQSFKDVAETSLHHFSDGCPNMGYGSAHYIRHVSNEGEIHVTLVMGKARVSPLKSHTVPRIEITAANTSSEVGQMVKKELDIKNISETYWADSQIALGYIHNEKKRFRIFVANRVKKIRSLTKKEQWKYVNTIENTADYSSRGISLKEEEKVKRWFKGPDFLWKPEKEWNTEREISKVADSDPEVKVQLSANVTTINTDDQDTPLAWLEEKFSNWTRMVRVMAMVKKFIHRCQKKETAITEFILSVNDIQAGEHALLKLIQTKAFSQEINFYGNQCQRIVGKQMSNKKRRGESKLWKLDPYVDESGILRVGGRLKKSTHNDSIKHPAILPKSSLAVQRIIEHQHRRIHHGGRSTTCNALRSAGYWIISANTKVRSVIHRCVLCRRYRGKLGEQMMADLPSERTVATAPFSHCGVDMFGPFNCKENRKVVKRYIALFTCFCSRAVHLEVTNDISTDSFIQALRRFLARRGPAISLRSDNGRNFVGADNEFRKAFQEMDHKKINNFLLSQSCDWIKYEKNPPHASHMGGVWERQIRTVRNVLTSLLHEHGRSLNEESLRTLMAEAESIVNSRPLTTECISDPTLEPLTPNHLLTLKTKPVLPPPGNFQNENIYCRKRWRHVQHLANEFWERWKKEYLGTLQERQKWNCPKRNFRVGDIVILREVDLPRQQWPLAKVVQVFPDVSDGLVRSVELEVPSAKNNLKRPIHKIVLLTESSMEE